MSGDRAQINFDFAVGVSLLAISMIVALTMVPSLFGGVTEGRIQGDQVAADRIAANLVEGDLGDAARPNELDADCTVALFDVSVSHCGFDATGSEPLRENVGVTDRNVNVTIVRDDDVQCWQDDGEGGLSGEDPACDPGELRLSGGGNAESGNELASATRAATLEGKQVTVLVRVW